MKIHIALVGGQIQPIYSGILYSNPDKIIYIYSNQTLDNVEKICNEVKIENQKLSFDSIDCNDIEEKVNLCYQQFSKEDVSIDITSGTKPWTYYFIKIFGDLKSVKFLYVDQNNNVWNLATKQCKKVQFSIDQYFKLIKYSPKSYIDFTSLDAKDITTCEDLISLKEYCHYKFYQLLKEYDNAPNKKEWNLKEGSFLRKSSDDKSYIFRLFGKNGFLEKTLSSNHISHFLFKRGWLEYKVAKIVHQWSESKEIRLNTVFSFETSEKDKNEIDVIVATDKRLIFIECKTQISSFTDIDKFCSVVRQYGGLSTKAIFITEEEMKKEAKEKCEDKGILTFSFAQRTSLVPTNKALIMLLESELEQSNTR